MIKLRKLQGIDKSSTMNGVPNIFGKKNVSQKPEKTIGLYSCRFLCGIPDVTGTTRNLGELENVTSNLFERQANNVARYVL
jgi:hypothetical protein